MHFQIVSIVLWSRDASLSPQVVPFEPGWVNVVMGLSRTGKSAVIPIIDYCLGARTCSIPKKIVRAACSWFGVIVETAEGQKLFARREPGGAASSDDVFIHEAGEVAIPSVVPAPNSTAGQLRRKLDEIAGLPAIGFNGDNPKDSFDSRPSFRDLMAFVFQPQNVVANSDVLFYRTDQLNHKIKLARNVLPYALGAITVEALAARYEIDRLERALQRKVRERESAQKASSRWESEVAGHLDKASELGLIEADSYLDLDHEKMLELLRQVAKKTVEDFQANSSTITNAIGELTKLEAEEAKLSEEISALKSRQTDLSRLREGAGGYHEALKEQKDRLALSNWVLADGVISACPVCGSGLECENERVGELRRQLREIEEASTRVEQVPVAVDREVHLVRQGTDELFARLNELRRRKAALTGSSQVARERQFQSLNIALFLGRLQQAISLYDETREDGELAGEIANLERLIAIERRKVDERVIGQRLEFAVAAIANEMAPMMPKLDNDHPTHRAELVVSDLTLRILGEEGESFLWSIGSGSNHLSYHVATMLALHRFFLAKPSTPVPGLIVFDQPSQVYFPEKIRTKLNPDGEWEDQDVESVRKIFKLMGEVVERSGGKLQIIVLDHAPESVWGNLEGVTKAVDWRSTGQKLVPPNWPGAQG